MITPSNPKSKPQTNKPGGATWSFAAPHAPPCSAPLFSPCEFTASPPPASAFSLPRSLPAAAFPKSDRSQPHDALTQPSPRPLASPESRPPPRRRAGHLPVSALPADPFLPSPAAPFSGGFLVLPGFQIPDLSHGVVLSRRLLMRCLPCGSGAGFLPVSCGLGFSCWVSSAN
jgi:hypothetical protein